MLRTQRPRAENTPIAVTAMMRADTGGSSSHPAPTHKRSKEAVVSGDGDTDTDTDTDLETDAD